MQYNISFSTLIFSYQVTRGEQVPMKCPKIKKSLLELLAQQTVTHFSLKIRKFIGSAVSPRNSRGKKKNDWNIFQSFLITCERGRWRSWDLRSAPTETECRLRTLRIRTGGSLHEKSRTSLASKKSSPNTSSMFILQLFFTIQVPQKSRFTISLLSIFY